MPEKKLTDADLMTGFNPAFGVSAEEIEARQEEAEPSAAAPEGEPTGADEPAAPPAASPAEVEVRLDGRAFKAPKDIAEAFTREINRRDGTRGAELQQLRERLAHLEGSLSTKTPAEPESTDTPLTEPDPELAIENPAEYQKQLLAFNDAKTEAKLAALAQQYREAEAAKDRETARRAAWQTHVEAFYSNPENKVLVGNEDIVDLVMAQNQDKLAPLPVEEGFKELSRLAKERVAKLTGQAPEVRARSTPRPAVLEGSSRRDSALRQPAPEQTGPRSLTQALKERRTAALNAFAKGGNPRTVASR